jgi:hypothetical protein
MPLEDAADGPRVSTSMWALIARIINGAGIVRASTTVLRSELGPWW